MEYELVYGLPKAEVLAQMAEELTEAAQAALKLRRAMDGGNPTPISVDTGMNNLIEELADCQLCEDIFFHGMATQCVNHAYREIDRIKSEKMERWETRLESAKMRLYAVAVGTKDTIKDIITVSAINPAPILCGGLIKWGSSMRPLRSIITAHTAAHCSIILLPLRVLCWTIRTRWA